MTSKRWKKKTEKVRPAKEPFLLLSDMLLVFLALFGATASLVTGFSLNVSLPHCLLFSVFLAVLYFAIRLYPSLWYISEGVCTFLLCYRRITVCDGMAGILGQIFTLLAKGFPQVSFFRDWDFETSYGAETEAMLFLCAYTGLALAAVMVYSKRICTVVAALIPLPAFVLCFLVIDATMPALWAVALLLLYWGLLLIGINAAPVNRNAAGHLRLCAGLPLSLLILLACLLSPQGKYGQTEVREASALYKTAEAVCTAMTDIGDVLSYMGKNKSETRFAKKQSGRNADTTISYIGSSGNSSKAFTVMQVKTDETGVLYLRECCYDLYTGQGMEKQNLYSGDADSFFTPTQYLDGNGNNLHTVSLRGVHARHLFVPYFPKEISVPYTADGNCGLWNQNNSSAYTITCYSGKDTLHIPDFFMKTDTQDSFYDTYTALPSDETRSALWALPVFTNTPMYGQTTTDAIAAFVSQSAAYSHDADRMPADATDFAVWFLSEAEKGYCVHFATAAVALFRAYGIPARLCTGYCVNVTEADTWTDVKSNNAHAWAEIYTELLGWVCVETTPPSDDTAQTESTAPVSDETAEETTAEETETAEPEETVDTEATETEAVTADSTETKTGGAEAPSDPPTDGKKTEKRTGKNFSAVCITAAVLLLCGGLYFLRFSRIRAKKETLFYAPYNADNARARILALYHCAERLTDVMPDTLTAIANKAKFSDRVPTEEEQAAFLSWYEERCRYFRASDGILLRLYHRFWLFLW